MEGMTTSGFKFTINEMIKKDKFFLKACSDLQKNPSDIDCMDRTISLALGEKGYEKLIKHVQKNNEGFCPVDVLAKEFTEIIQADDSVKK